MMYTVGCRIEGVEEVDVSRVEEYFEGKEMLALDTETTSKDCHNGDIISLQVGDGECQFFIDVRKIDILLFKGLIENKMCILANSKFDYKFLKKSGIMMEHIWDVMLAECVLYCGYEKWGYSLDKLSERYLNISMDKSVRKDFSNFGDRDFEAKHIEYGCKDVAHLLEIREKQLVRLRELDLERCINLENEVVKALADIEYNGMGFDREKWLEIALKTQAEAKAIVAELDGIVREEPKLNGKYVLKAVQGGLFGENGPDVIINYASPKQISQICTELGYPTESTDEKHLTRIKGKHKFFSKLLELRKKNKIISTYGESFLKYINPRTGRIHTSFWQVVETGRTSSGSKSDNAPNCQNLPRSGGFIECFTAREGYKWISSDFGSQEARLMASASGDKNMLAILNSGKNFHCEAGTMMFKKPITKEDKELYYKTKTVNFMVPYGAASQKLADEMEIPVSEASRLLELHAETFPELHDWLRKMGKQAKRDGFITTIGPIQRKRFFPEMEQAKALRKTVKFGDKATWKSILITEGQTERAGGNTPIQGGSADMTKESLIATRDLIKRYNYMYGEEVVYIVGMVHDSIECEAREDIAEDFAKSKNKIMIEIGNKYLSRVEMEVDTTIDNHWKK